MSPRIVPALCLALLAPLPAAGQDLPALYDVTGVASGDVLNLRAGPDATSPSQGSLAPGQRGVEVVALSQDGAWGLVGQGEGGGWASMRFLGRQPGELPWWTMQDPLRCLGTEPFWSLTTSKSSLRGILATPEPPAVKMQTTALWPGAEGSATAGVALSGAGVSATLLLTGQSCSDGMSDRSYGIAATLLLTGAPPGGGAPLAGCCTLSAR